MYWLLTLSCSEPKVQDTVTDETEILGLVVTPNDMIIPVSGRTQLQATGLYPDRSTVDLTSSVEWFVEYYAVLNISEDLDSEGELVAISEGSSRVYAEYEGIKSNYANVIVTAASVDRISITPNELQLIDGDQVQLQATATFTNGESGLFTQQVRWITDNGAVVQFDEYGLLQAVGQGETEVTAVYEEIISDPVEIEVMPYYEGGKPDLRVTDASIEDRSATRIVRTTITNQGSQSAIGFWLDIFNQSSEPAINDVGDDYHLFEYLGPGHSTSHEFEMPLSSAVPSPWLMVDAADEIEESHENNNTFQVTTSSSSGQAADLVVSYFELYEYDGVLEVFVDVTNQGQQTADFFFVDLFPNQSSAPQLYDDGAQYLAIENLGPGATDFADFTIDTSCSGCKAWILIDGYDNVSESNEANNTAGPVGYSY